jgi:Dolichyl-phosphate-mannose-protein mannosyltransferase
MRFGALLQHGTTAGGVMQKALRPALFLSMLLLAAYLRITGLAWGLSGGYGHDRNLQPDEWVSLRGVLQLDLLKGRIKAPGAYFEGTFNYYLWAVPQAVLKLFGKKEVPLTDSTDAKDISNLLYICRWMSVIFDLCTIVIVFLAIREATQNFYPSLLGALCYAVVPMEVIYAHFMRTHILSNLLCALVIWLSLKLRKSRRWQLLITVGFISGVAMATRYPVGLIVVIPCLYLLFTGSDDLARGRNRLWLRAKALAAGPVWLIGLGFVIGLFLGHPMLFLSPSDVTKAIADETLKYASLQEFSTNRLVNLSVVWDYVRYLIPYAMYSLLWIVPYCSILYLLFRQRLYSQSIPILIFSFLYLYFMGKGYLRPFFAKATMLLFPGFCVLAGLACNDLLSRFRKGRTVTLLLAVMLVLVVGPSVLFNTAYARAMRHKDARLVLRKDLQKLIGKRPATIGIPRFGPSFYTVMPATAPLKSDKVTVQPQEFWQKADFFLVGFPRQPEPAQINTIIRAVEVQGVFKYEKGYYVPVRIFGRRFSLARFPSDMTYPFPMILLFRAKVSNTPVR